MFIFGLTIPLNRVAKHPDSARHIPRLLMERMFCAWCPIGWTSGPDVPRAAGALRRRRVFVHALNSPAHELWKKNSGHLAKRNARVTQRFLFWPHFSWNGRSSGGVWF